MNKIKTNLPAQIRVNV